MSEIDSPLVGSANGSAKFVFLSYSREDEARVRQAYLALREARLNPWMDDPPVEWLQDTMPTGTDWDVYLQSHLRDASAVVLFLSESSAANKRYFREELRTALDLAESRPRFALPVLLDDTPLSSFENAHERLGRLHALRWPANASTAQLVEAVRNALPPQGAVLTAESFCLVSTSWYSARHNHHRVDVAVSGRREDLARVAQVVYFLPPQWPTSPAASRDVASNFLLKELAWADLVVRARLYIAGQASIALAHHARLTDHGPRIKDALNAVSPR